MKFCPIFILLWSIAAVAVTDIPYTQSICELLISGKPRVRERDFLRNNVVNRGFLLTGMNPQRLPPLTERLQFPEPVPQDLQMRFLQSPVKSDATMIFRSNPGTPMEQKWRIELFKTIARGVYQWIPVDLKGQRVREYLDHEVRGEVREDEIFDVLTAHTSRPIRTGLLLANYNDRSRLYMTWGFAPDYRQGIHRDSALHLVLGFDVPCSEVSKFVRYTTGIWRPIDVITDTGDYCRIPLAHFVEP